MKCKYVELMVSFKWFLFEERIVLIIELVLRDKKKPTSSNNALALIHENENMNTVYLEEPKNKKIGLLIKILEEICSMTLCKV